MYAATEINCSKWTIAYCSSTTSRSCYFLHHSLLVLFPLVSCLFALVSLFPPFFLAVFPSFSPFLLSFCFSFIYFPSFVFFLYVSFSFFLSFFLYFVYLWLFYLPFCIYLILLRDYNQKHCAPHWTYWLLKEMVYPLQPRCLSMFGITRGSIIRVDTDCCHPVVMARNWAPAWRR